MKISAALIVKNESDVLDRCLSSLATLDEIVVVDTGSKDTTKEIARKYTDKVFDFEWCDDFAKARNFAIEHCKNEWILIIDADEFLPTTKGLDELCNPLFEATTMDVYMNGMKSHNAIRLIKNTVRYLYPIHEYPNAKRALYSQFRLDHVKGTAILADPDRNVRILERAIEEHPEEPRYKYYLGNEYFGRKRWQEAFAIYKRYIDSSSYPSENNDAVLLMSRALYALGQTTTASIYCAIAISLNPQFKEAFRFMADLSDPKYAKRWEEIAETATNEDVLFIREEKK